MTNKIPHRTRREQRGDSRTNMLLALAALLVIGLVAAVFIFESRKGGETQAVAQADPARDAALASVGAPTRGDPGAAVHIVEFLDPACGTCALFFPMVEQWMSEVPGRIRLSVRHAAFHDGSEYAVKALEASRKQNKYWETLEAVLGAQDKWVTNHVVQPDKLDPVLAGVGLDMEQLRADMNSMDVLQRFEQDRQDAIYLKVSMTPEYFVNGRPLPSFGAEQLANLIREELEK